MGLSHVVCCTEIVKLTQISEKAQLCLFDNIVLANYLIKKLSPHALKNFLLADILVLASLFCFSVCFSI